MKPAAANPVLERQMAESAFALARAQRQGLLRHFGFRESPFGVTPDPEFLFWTRMHSAALQAIVSSIESDLGFSVLLGAPGTGKTSLLFHLLALYRESARTAFIFQTQCKPDDLIRHIASELDLAAPPSDEVALHQQLNAMLLEEARAGRKVLILIDEAQDLPGSAFEAVRLLSDFETAQSKLLNIVFSGSPQLGAMLSTPDLSQLAQRVSTIARLEPLSEDEVGDYVRFRLAIAVGGPAEGPFLPEALAEIAGRSQGIPRIVNAICYRALLLASTDGQLSVGRELVRKAAKDLQLSEPSSKDSTVTPGAWQLDGAHTTNLPWSKSTLSEQSLKSPAETCMATVTLPAFAAKRFAPTSSFSSSVRNQKNGLRGQPVPANVDQGSQTGMRPSTTFRNGGWHRYGSAGLIAAVVLLACGLSIAWNQLRAKPGAIQADPVQNQPQESLKSQAQPPAPEMDRGGAPQNSVQQSDRTIPTVPTMNSNARQSAPDQASLLSDIGPNLLMPPKIPSQLTTPVELSSPNTAADASPPSGNLAQLAASGLAASPRLEGTEIAVPSMRRASFSLHPIKLVQPEYPARARLSHIEGEVQVELSIDRSGVVRSARALSGNAILAQAAEDAARQWRYAPDTGADATAFPKVTRILFNFRFNSATK
jgi:TonB family protein